MRFHALIWPAILLAAGQPLPTTLVVHDYVTAGGRKIGKSLGNAVDPVGARRPLRRRRVALVAVPRGAAARRGRLHRRPARRVGRTATSPTASGTSCSARSRSRRGRSASDAIDRVPECELTATVPTPPERGSTRRSARFDPRAATEALIGLVDAANRLRRRDASVGAAARRRRSRRRARGAGAARRCGTRDRRRARAVRSRRSRRGCASGSGREGGAVCPGPPVQPRLEVTQPTRA